MKKITLIFITLLITANTFAQKKELENVKKELDNGNPRVSKTLLLNVQPNISSFNFNDKSHFYFLKGKTYYKLIKNDENNFLNYKIAGENLNKLILLESKQQRFNYSTEAKAIITSMSGELINKAITAQKNNAFKKASEILYLTYNLQQENKDLLYFAASNAISAKDYNKALKYYEELKAVNYTGIKLMYFATNNSTGVKESFPDKTARDFIIKSGTHSKPVETKTKSRYPEIIKNISWIYTNIIGDNEKALAAVNEAIKINPDDTSLLLTKGNIYYKQGNKKKFKEIMQEIITKYPNDVDSHYNIGVISAENGEIETARKAYTRVLTLNPAYTNAAINLSKTYIDEAGEIVDLMNKLGSSTEENKKFDDYQKEQIALYKKATLVLENIVKNITIKDSNLVGILTQLKGLYSFLQDDIKYNNVISKLAEVGK